jgi:colanic acid/amylovoran biosynthesis glycosyltransferase
MRIAYLINQYPAISHTFVRREIEALESLGATVERFSLRQMVSADLPDQLDQEENERTCALLGGGLPALFSPVLRMAGTHPEAFARAEIMATKNGLRSDRGVLRHFGYLAEACRLVQELKTRGVHHVHAHFGTNSAEVAMLAHELAGITYSFTVHGPEEFDKPDLLSLREKIEHAEFVVAVSSFGQSQLYRYCDSKNWSKVHVVRCGLDRSYMEHAPTPVPDVPRLVTVGRLCEQKGQLLLVQAAAKLKRAGLDFELVLVGDGPLRGDLESLIEAEQLQDRVRITGWATGSIVQEEIEQARALVLPSFAEGLPVVLMEALARGRPVISTYVAGIPELVRDGECGWLVPAGSVDATAEAMRRVLETSAARLTEMGRNGNARVRRMHDAKVNARKLLRLFERYTTGNTTTLNTRSDARTYVSPEETGRHASAAQLG